MMGRRRMESKAGMTGINTQAGGKVDKPRIKKQKRRKLNRQEKKGSGEAKKRKAAEQGSQKGKQE